MSEPKRYILRLQVRATRWSQWIHRYFLLLLVLCYLLAGVAPGLGIQLRSVQVNLATLSPHEFSLAQLLLALLLVLAGLGIDVSRLKKSLASPGAFAGATLAKLFAPALFLAGTTGLIYLFEVAWLAPLLLGLALVAASPAAGSSPAWTQTAGGNVSLSLGIVVSSTLFNPWFASTWLNSFASHLNNQQGDLAQQVFQAINAKYFLAWVIMPTLLGMSARWIIGTQRLRIAKPYLRLLSSCLLLLLIYAFVAAPLRGLSKQHAFSLLAWALFLSAAMCAHNFAAGLLINRLLSLNTSDRLAVLFGVGMHNNGIAMLVAASTLAENSPVFLTIVAYALTQHLLAGLVDALATRTSQQPKPISKNL